MKIVLINPNTSRHITDLMVNQVRRTIGLSAQVEGVTAAFGPRIISSRVENGLAIHGALDAAAREAQDADAIILGVSMDTGLKEMRELMQVPVIGMAEAGLKEAARVGGHIGCITVGEKMIPLYQEVTDCYASSGNISWRGIDLPGAFDRRPGAEVLSLLTSHCDRFVEEARLDVLVLCGAILTGYAPLMNLGIPVVDCIDAAASAARSQALNVEAGRIGQAPPDRPRVRSTDGLGEALAGMLLSD